MDQVPAVSKPPVVLDCRCALVGSPFWGPVGEEPLAWVGDVLGRCAAEKHLMLTDEVEELPDPPEDEVLGG